MNGKLVADEVSVPANLFAVGIERKPYFCKTKNFKMQTPSNLTDLAENVADLDNQTFQSFLSDVYKRRAKQRTPAIPQEEVELLKKINSGFPVEKWERLDFLDSKMEHSALLEEEHAELMALNEANEAYMVRRLVLLGQLAELRKTTLREVMKQLGIRHESDV